MTSKEFKKILATAIEKDWFSSKEVTINLPTINFNKKFTGISNLYDFLNQELNGWDSINEKIPNELTSSKNYFTQIKTQLENLVTTQINNNSNQLENYWNNYINNYIYTNTNNIFRYNDIETEFLIDIYIKEPNYYQGAYNYITDNFRNVNSNKNDYIGASIANDFFKKEALHKFSRKEAEQKSFENLKRDFQKSISESSSTVTDHLKDANEKYKEYVESLEDLKNERDLSFQEWFDNSKEVFETFDKTSNQKIKELEKLYQENLALKAPAKYWEDRAKEMRIQGQCWLAGLCVSTIVGVVCLFNLLDSIGTGEFEKMFSNTGASIKWSIVFITFISFLAFLIRTFTKLTFSSFHLSRDAQERKQLTYVYLALKENDAVSDIDRNIVLQSIFSRTDTGLLNEDSSPTMPTSIIEKVVKTS